MYSYFGYEAKQGDVVRWEDETGVERFGVVEFVSNFYGTAMISRFDENFDETIETGKLRLYHDYHNNNRCLHGYTTFIGLAGGGYHVCVQCDERLS